MMKGIPEAFGGLEKLVHGSDGVVQGVCMQAISRDGHPNILHRPLQHIYPLQVCCEPIDDVLDMVEGNWDPESGDP